MAFFLRPSRRNCYDAAILATAPKTRSLPEASRRKRRLGQVFTPRDIADWMVRTALADRPKRWLDPSLGGGVFIDALRDAMVDAGDDFAPVVHAFEIDDQLDIKPRKQWPQIDVRLARRDFLTAGLRTRFDACVANPPYVRHHELEYPPAIWQQFDEQIGTRISRNTNLYCLFILRIWSMLAPNGRAVIITPLEWLNADFGRAIKSYLLNENAIDSMWLFDDASTVFGDALTTAGITVLRRGRTADEPIRVATISNGQALTRLSSSAIKEFKRRDLDPDAKWTALLRQQDERRVAIESNTTSLATFATCSRGIATGANDYFTLTENQRRERELDKRDLSPCVTRASDLQAGVFDREKWQQLCEAGKRVWLLTPRQTCNKNFVAYLDAGRQRGIDRRHLPSHRPVWYRPENRPPAPILISVFFRERPRVVWNEMGALNLTAYHGIYTKLNGENEQQLYALYKWLASDAATDALLAQSRVYGGGLRKLEPRDVMAVQIPRRLVR